MNRYDREEEQHPTLRYNSPPVPAFATLLTARGLVGYKEMKQDQMREARTDRLVTRDPENLKDVKRWAFVSKLAAAFPKIGVQRIADEVVPWDVGEFKRRVVAAETACQQEQSWL